MKVRQLAKEIAGDKVALIKCVPIPVQMLEISETDRKENRQKISGKLMKAITERTAFMDNVEPLGFASSDQVKAELEEEIVFLKELWSRIEKMAPNAKTKT